MGTFHHLKPGHFSGVAIWEDTQRISYWGVVGGASGKKHHIKVYFIKIILGNDTGIT